MFTFDLGVPLRSPLLLWPIIFTAACGPSLPTSDSKALIGKAEIRLISSEERATDENAQRVGAILEVIAIDEELIARPICNGIRIGPRHLLTAGHCAKVGQRLAFAPHYLAKDPRPESLSFASLASGPRLLFSGEYDSETNLETWRAKPELGAPVYKDSDKDFAIFDLGYESSEPFVDLETVSEAQGSDLESLKLYGFPNGVPLTLAEDCRGEASFGVLRHDCDSLTGSSGGMVIDAQARPLALHTFSSVVNRPSDTVAEGIFEDLATIDSRAESVLAAKSPEEKDRIFWECRDLPMGEAKDLCQKGKGLNRAVFLSVIRDELKTKAPELYSAMSVKVAASCSHPKPKKG